MKDTYSREIAVETTPYENTYAKKPRGYQKWNFHFGGYTYGEKIIVDVTIQGKYSEAKNQAIRICAAKGRNLVVVLP